MLVRPLQTQQDKYSAGTYDGIHINAQIVAAAVNTPLSSSAYNPDDITVKVVYKTKNGVYNIMHDKLSILGTFATLDNGLHYFRYGVTKKHAATAVKEERLHTCFLPFYGHIRVDSFEELICEVSVGANAITADQNASIIDFYASPSIGYMTRIPLIKSEVVQANASSQPFNIGDNIIRLAFLNFNKESLAEEVISSLALNSDRFDMTYQFNQLVALRARTDYGYAERYSSALPISDAVSTGRAFRGLDALPQSVVVFNGYHDGKELDRARVNIAFNGSQVANSANFVAWVSYETSQNMVVAAAERENKHVIEKLDKLPEGNTK